VDYAQFCCDFVAIFGLRMRLAAEIAQLYSAGYRLDDRGFDSCHGLGIFLFTGASRPALEPTQSPIQWVPGAFSRGVERPGREVDHLPSSST
jgi:hypothetical protein